MSAFFVGLGPEVEGRTFVEGEFLDTVCGIPDSRTEIVMLKPPDDGGRLELARFVRPDSVPGSPAAMANELGLRNVSFEVNDLQAAVDWAATEGYGLVGGIGEYEGAWRMAYVRGPEGIIVSLAERMASAELGCGRASQPSTVAVMTADEFVPADFDPPTSLTTDDFRLEPLGPQHNEADHAAWMSSIEHIRSTPGYPDGNWPPPTGMTLERNLSDLRRHADDFTSGRGFTFTVLDPADNDVIGCVYLYPSASEDWMSQCSRGCGLANQISTDHSPTLSQTGSPPTGRGSTSTAAVAESELIRRVPVRAGCRHDRSGGPARAEPAGTPSAACGARPGGRSRRRPAAGRPRPPGRSRRPARWAAVTLATVSSSASWKDSSGTVHQAELLTGRTADALLEPHPLHPGDVLEQPEQRRRRRDEPARGLAPR